MTVRWATLAAADIRSLRKYINQREPKAGSRVARIIISTANRLLSENMMIGHPGRVPGTRELVIPETSYIAPYRVHFGYIEILRVFHHGQPWPEQL
jgi:toxin ParE1/3/4